MSRTIQRTSKPFKAMIAAGFLLAVIGTPVLFFNNHGAAAAIALMAGIAVYVVGKIGAWWSNG